MIDWDASFEKYKNRSVVLPLRYNPFAVRKCHDLLECDCCGECCNYDKVPVNRGDIERAPEIEQYVADGHLITKGGCPFLVDNKCSIYDRRPDTCWLFPLQTPVDGTLDGEKIKLTVVRLRCKAALNVAKAVLLESEKDGHLKVQEDLSLCRI